MKNITHTSNTYGFFILCVEWMLIVASFYFIHYSNWFIPLGLLLIGKSQFELTDNIGHYASHNLLFRTRVLNKKLSFLYYLPVFTTFEEWRIAHIRHHTEFGKSTDPEYETFARWGLYTKPFFLCMLLVPITDFKKNIRQLEIWRDTPLFLFSSLVMALFLLSGHKEILLIWLCAFFFTRPYWAFISLVIEHWKVPSNHKNGTKWLMGSRSVKGILVLIKPYGDAYHWLHHEKPNIPPHRLSREYKKLAETNSAPPLYSLKTIVHEINS